MKIQNATPHTIVLMDKDNNPIASLPPSGILARVKAETVIVGEVEIDGVKAPLRTTVLGQLQGLPPVEADTFFVVSFIAAQAAVKEGRMDVLVTDDAVRDPAGRVIGCRAFSRL